MTTTPPPPPPDNRRRPFQFSMTSLMVVTTLVGVALGLAMILPNWIFLLGLAGIEVAFIAFLAAGVLFAKSGGQAFCAGALAAHLMATVGVTQYSFSSGSWYSSSLAAIQQLGSLVLLDLFAGWVCVRARRFWERRAQ